MNISTTDRLQKEFVNLWGTGVLCKLFDKSSMTIHMWRKNRGLPAITLEGEVRPIICFVPEDVLAWAKENGVEMKEQDTETKKVKRERL